MSTLLRNEGKEYPSILPFETNFTSDLLTNDYQNMKLYYEYVNICYINCKIVKIRLLYEYN